MVTICSWTQDWAIIRRYLISMLRYPFASTTRVVLLPGLILGFCWYLLNGVSDSEYMNRVWWAALISSITLMTTMINVYSFANTLVTDKATGMKSLMLSMGLSRFHYYRATTLCFLTLILPVTMIIAVVSKTYLLPKVSYFTILAIFLLFSLQLDALMTALVSFIKSTNYTFIILLILILEPSVNEISYAIVKQNETSWTKLFLFLVSFSPYMTVRLFVDRNIIDDSGGAVLSELRLLDQPLYLIFLSQLFWTVLFKSFAYWFEEVCPWQTVSGVRHPCFCFWGGAKTDQVSVNHFTDDPAISAKYFENTQKYPSDIGISVNHVTKSYRKVPAVNDVSFAIYKGETTLLLGHNGAGKSTLMNMILGLTQPDNGAVKIMARSQLQTSIGVCPQTSVLDENLTVKQHLELFNDLKSNISGYERTAHIRQTIDDVSLTDQGKKLPTELSGGMKRKLSLAIAFIGKSQVLILDEPSSGLDPDSRMFVWNAIRRYRSDRTVLLSTQHMEEADYLGDRIAIMSSGRIVCCGSSVFLNGVFGTGYKLRLECKLSKKKHIMDHIRRSYFDGAQLTESSMDSPRDAKSDPTVDLVIELNKSTSNKQTDNELDLTRLLEDFENNSDKLGIGSYGLKSSSIEDVMLNTSKYFAHEAKAATQLVMTSVSGHIAAITDKKVLHEPSCWTQLTALVMKHLHVNLANLFSVIVLKLGLPIWGSYLLIVKVLKNEVGVDQHFQDPTLCILFAHLIYFPVRERATKFKTVQLDTRAAVWIYWLSQVVIDLTGLFVCLVSINTLAYIYITDMLLVSASKFHTVISVATLIFYLACMVFCYCLSNILNDQKTAIGYLFIIMFLSTALYYIIYLFRLTVLKMSALQWFQDGVAYLGVLLSPADAYAFFLMGLKARCYIPAEGKLCAVHDGISPIAIGLGALCVQIVAYSILLVLIESQVVNLEWYFSLRNLFAFFRRPLIQRARDTREIDRDVTEETTKAMAVIDDPNNGHALVAARLNKSYIKHTKVIEDLAFTVNQGECFGLLGVNGSGKTTTFSMLSGETRPDSGRIIANNCYYDQDLHRYRELFGYDPQATPELSLTPYQALYLMARLRGVNEHSIPMMIGSILELLEMSEHTHKPDSKLSGGTKRKLALGMAIIGNPAILALDEPTAGVDPLARRSIWQLLRSLRTRNNTSIIISSHAMEECEAICDRISIMARGKLRCIGTFLHLRTKFAKGFTLRVQFTKIEGSSRPSRLGERQQKNGNASRENSQQRRSVVSTVGSSIGASQHSPSNIKSTAPATSTPQKSIDSRRSSTTSLQATDSLVNELQHLLESAIGPSVFHLTDRNVNSVIFSITDNRVRRSILFRMMRDFRQKHPNVSYMINDSSLEEIFISLAREEQAFEQTQRQQQQPEPRLS